jgi:cobalt/nickel transport system permease protein
MANELLSVPVAAGGFAVSGVWLAAVCHKIKDSVSGEKAALMGIMGAFVFAAQMVNFQLPLMPGTSGHLVGAVLLAIILGPHLAVVTLTSVVVVQCLVFQDGGILALGCNILNMVVVPVYVGNFLYRLLRSKLEGTKGVYIAAVAACVLAVEAGAVLVPLQVGLSGVLSIPVLSFLLTMAGVHLIIGLMEGLITAAVLCYIMSVRPSVLDQGSLRNSLSAPSFVAVTAMLTLIIAGGVSLLANENPDGLEWSYAERPDQTDFEPVIENDSKVIAAADQVQSKYSPMPDYSRRNTSIGEVNTEAVSSQGWTSLAGVFGAIITMALILLAANLLSKSKHRHA